MKITKTQLKQIIKEELKQIVEREDDINNPAKIVAQLSIKTGGSLKEADKAMRSQPAYAANKEKWEQAYTNVLNAFRTLYDVASEIAEPGGAEPGADAWGVTPLAERQVKRKISR
jgi:hypothetical protein